MTPASGLRLSPQQQHLWPLTQDSEAYRAQCSLEIAGALDPLVLRKSLEAIVARHEILRTGFVRRLGVRLPIQVVADSGRLDWRQLDGESAAGERLRELIHEERLAPFDLELGSALRACLVALGAERHVLILTLPSLLADARSLHNLAAETVRTYAGTAPDDEEPVQYFDFSEWQHELLEDQEAEEGAAFWRRQHLADAPRLSLPGLVPAPAGTRFEPRTIELVLDEALAGRLEERAAELEVSPAQLLLAGWQGLLWRLSDHGEVVLGRSADGREDDELAGGLGLYARYLPLRCRFECGQPFAEAVRRVAQGVEAGDEWQTYWSTEAASSSAVSGSASSTQPVLLTAGYDYQAWPANWQAPGLRFQVASQYVCLDRFAIRLSTWRRPGGGLHLKFHYDPAAIDEESVGRLSRQLEVWLGAALEHPEAAIDQLALIDHDERNRLLVEFNRPVAPTTMQASPVHLRIAEQAERTPEAAAVRGDEEELSYRQLIQRAERLAATLRRHGVGPEVAVAVCLERTPELMVAILGIWQAGGAFLPLDSTYPRQRLAYLIGDAAPALVLTRSDLRPVLPENMPPCLYLDQTPPESAEPEAEASPGRAAAGPDQLAYVIYTSGSTGKPKGVMVSHRGLANYLDWCLAGYPLAAGSVTPVHSPIGFDLTITSLFAPLLAGGTAWLLPENRGFEALTEALVSGEELALVKLTPSHLTLLAEAGVTDAGRAPAAFILGGEALQGADLRFWQQQWPTTRLINEYGPTEAVVGCTVHEVKDPAVAGPVAIGRPIPGMKLHVLDHHLQPLPPEVAGELFIGGIGITRGYLARPVATAEKFVPDCFSQTSGARLYRSGDRARYRPDGCLEFLGRNDHQVKVRGFRIELGEIEAVLLQHPGIRETVVAARDDVASGDLRLVAYVIPDKQRTPSVSDLRSHVLEQLPEHMMPVAFLMMEGFPLTPNGKVDRAALPGLGHERPDLAEAYVAPSTETERLLAELWGEVLGLDKVGTQDRFFALGGDSIRSVRLVALAREHGLELTVPDLFQHQTVAALAEHLAQTEADEPAEEEELAHLLDEIESLSEEEARRRFAEPAG